MKMGVPARHASKARRAGHRVTAGFCFRGVPERYVAGANTRGRPEGGHIQSPPQADSRNIRAMA